MSDLIKVETFIEGDKELVWECWTNPKHIINWYFATEDWHTPKAINDFKVDGLFSFRMEAKDGSRGFDFAGRYKEIYKYKEIRYSLEDGREVDVIFREIDQRVLVTEIFEAELTISIEMQKKGWQSILDNFKLYVDSLIIRKK